MRPGDIVGTDPLLPHLRWNTRAQAPPATDAQWFAGNGRVDSGRVRANTAWPCGTRHRRKNPRGDCFVDHGRDPLRAQQTERQPNPGTANGPGQFSIISGLRTKLSPSMNEMVNSKRA